MVDGPNRESPLPPPPPEQKLSQESRERGDKLESPPPPRPDLGEAHEEEVKKEPPKERRREEDILSGGDDYKEMADEYDRINDRVQRLLENFPLNPEWRAKVEREARESMENSDLKGPQLEAAVRSIVERQEKTVRGALLTAYGAVSSAPNYKARAERLNIFLDLGKRLQEEGMIGQDKWSKIHEDTEGVMEKLNQRDDFVKRQGNRLVDQMEQRGILKLTEAQKTILRNLSTSTESLVEMLKQDYHFEDDRQKGWNDFYRDVADIFEQIFSVVDSRPKDFFNEAFSPFYAGQAFNELISEFERVGAELIGSDPQFARLKVTISDTTTEPDPAQKGEGAKDVLARVIKPEVELHRALSNVIVNKMVSRKNGTEYLHNIEAICDIGLGWETLSQQAARMSNVDMDFLFMDDPDLTNAYNFYLSALEKYLAANKYVVTTDFGKPDQVYNLDDVQRTAFFQLLAMRAGESGLKEGTSEFVHLEQILRRKVRMASGMAKGVTAEFWGVLLRARMPHTYFIYDSREGYEKETGERIKIYDPNTYFKSEEEKRKYMRYGLVHTFQSASQGGYERMIGELDLDMVLERFSVPRYQEIIRYAFEPKELKREEKLTRKEKKEMRRRGEKEHKPPGPYSRGNFDHTLSYEIREEIEDAYYQGRSDRLAGFDEDFVIFAEKMKTKAVDLMHRGDWRFEQFREFVRYTDQTSTVIDVDASLLELKKIGPYLIKTFAGSDPIVARLGQDTIKGLIGVDKTYLDLSEREQKRLKKAFKNYCYENIFERMMRVSPSRFIALEIPRYSPRGEEFIHQRLRRYLRGKFEDYPEEFVDDKAYKLFVSSLGLAEKVAWERLKEDKRTEEEKEKDHFDVSDIDAAKEELLIFFKRYKESVGTDPSQGKGQGPTFIDRLGDQEYLAILKEFYGELDSSLKMPRWKREDKKNTETLPQRYAKLLGDSRTNLDLLIGGDDFDFSNFLMQQAGKRVTERMMTETFTVASKAMPALKKLLNEGIAEFAKGQYSSRDDMEQAILKYLAEPMKEIHVAVGQTIDKGQADEWVTEITVYLARMLGKDRPLRIKGLGYLLGSMRRLLTGTQDSLISDYFVPTIRRPITRLDSDGVYLLIQTVLNTCDVPLKSRVISGRRKLKLGPFTIKRPVYKSAKISIEDALKTEGVAPGWAQVLETYLPVGLTALAFLLIVLAHMGYKKQTEQQ